MGHARPASPWPTSCSTPPGTRWRRINGHELVPLVRAGDTFIDSKLQERSNTKTDTTNKDTTKTGSVAA